MNGIGMTYTAAYIVLAFLIMGVFAYRIRKGTFKKHITAEAAIVVCFVLVTVAVKELAFIVQLIGVVGIAGIFNYGRLKK